MIGDSLTTESRVADLAAGTGEVSSQLLHRGFSDLVLADASAEILQVARGKLSSLAAANFISTKMEPQTIAKPQMISCSGKRSTILRPTR